MKAVALCSGGLDSTVSLAMAVSKQVDVILVIFFQYGQKAASREFDAVRNICAYYSLNYEVIPLSFLKGLTTTALVNRHLKLPTFSSFDELRNRNKIKMTAKNVWVPNRNALFINIAACYSEALGADLIITGFDKEEAETFPDNSTDFVSRINQCLQLSTLKRPKVKSFTLNFDKKRIVKEGLKLGVPLAYTWSCYLGDRKPCGKCESCQRSSRAFLLNNAGYER